MKLLLDTHALLWFFADDARLSANAKGAIENPANQSFVSMASCWEIAIKISLGKLDLGAPFEQVFPEELERNGIEQLPITVGHLNVLLSLPWHHRDPFDRLILAQAQMEGMTVVSCDCFAPQYGVPVLW